MAESIPACPDIQLFRDIFNASPIGIAVENLEGQPLFVNPAFCSFLGFDEVELSRKHCVDFSPPEDAAKDWEFFQQLRAGSIQNYRLDKRYFRRNGSLVWGRLSVSLLNSDPSPLVLAMVEDITDKKQAEEALRASEERLRLAQQAARIGTFEWNIQTGVNTWTRELEAMYGLPPGGFGGTQTAFENLVHPDDRARVIELVNWALKTGQPITGEWRVLWADGSIRWIAGRWQVFMNESGKPSRMVGINIDISDRKLAEQELSKANERLRLALEAGSAGGWDYDLKTGKSVWFGTAHAQLGMTPDETSGSGKEFWDRVHEDDRQRLEHALRVAREKHEEYAEDVRVVWRDGTTHWLRSRGRFQYDANGGAERSLGISLDITEQKRAEQDLLSSEQRYRLLFERNVAGVAIATLDGRLLDCNDGWVHILGYEAKDELLGRHASEFYFNPAERKPLVDELFEKQVVFSRELQLRRKDGTTVWVLFKAAVFHSDRETPIVQATMIDISEWKRAQEALRASEGRLRLAQQSARLGTFERDVRTGGITWAEGLEPLYGLPPGSVHGKTTVFFNDLIHPADRERTAHLIQQALKTGQPTEGEWRAIWPDGSVHWIAGRWQVLMDDSGVPSRVVGVNMDVTERKQAERALHAQEELLKIFVKNVPAAVAMLDREMHYLQVSDRWCTDYLSGREQVIGRSHYEIFPDMPERWKEVHRRALAGETLQADEDHWIGLDGSHWARWEVRPWKTPESGVGGILILTEDITRRKRAEEALAEMTRKLIQSQEQERDRIARELHDDISQRLALLAVELEQLRQDPSEIEARMQELRNQTSEISKDVQALSHDLHSSKLEYLGVVSGIKSWCKEFGERQEMEIDFRSDVPSALPLDVGRTLYRLLQEALHNASKHSGVRRVDVELREDSGEIHLIVSDKGGGFDVEAALQGKGLGLTSMRERVRLVNGTIDIQSKPMSGTTIHVRVPLPSMDSWRAAG